MANTFGSEERSDALEDAYQDIVIEQIVKNPQPNLNAIKAALELMNVNNDVSFNGSEAVR